MPSADTPAPMDFPTLRRTMADCQLRTFEVTDPAVLDAFETIPREAFVGAANAAVAYSDAALLSVAGGAERRLLAPMVLARMLQGAGARKTDRALVVGDGIGYAVAIVSRLAASVIALEAEPAFTAAAAAAFSSQGLANASAVTGPLAQGWTAGAPYDLILVNGAIEAGHEALVAQLAPGGRLAAVFREPGQIGRSAKAKLLTRLDHGIAEKWLFDAAAETLPAFRRAPAFVF